MKSKITPRPYQIEAVQSVYEYWATQDGAPVVVAPTGSGKSVIIAHLISDALNNYPNTRILVLADQKELIEQNSEALARVNPDIKWTIYSASCGIKDATGDIVFAQVQSIHKRAPLIAISHPQRKFFDIILIDEAHLINTKQIGMFRKCIRDLCNMNGRTKVAGFTATPYRMGVGYIWSEDNDMLFSGVCYEISIDKLIETNQLVKPIGYCGRHQVDRSKIERNNMGEFKEESATREFYKITKEAVKDFLARLVECKTILVFGCSVNHANQIIECLNEMGEDSCCLITGETPKKEREELISCIRNGKIRICVNVGVLTKGFDAPNIDAVVLLRATESPALYVQMVGRGLRPCEGKDKCIVLDYGGNVVRHGPINAVAPRKKGERLESIQMAKTCIACKALIAISASVCPHCGAKQPIKDIAPNHKMKADNVDIIDIQEPKWVKVKSQKLYLHNIPGMYGHSSIRVVYTTDNKQKYQEFVHPRHYSKKVKEKAKKWFEDRGASLMSSTQAEKIQAELKCPTEIKVSKHGRFWEVSEYKWHD